MLGRLGKFTDYSSSVVKARLNQEATTYCSDEGMVMLPTSSTDQDAGYGEYASAEIRFECLLPGDARLTR